MRRLVRSLVVIAVLVAIAFLLRRTVLAPEPIAVTVAIVGRGVVEETVTSSRAGAIRSHRHAVLSPEIGGRVVSLPRREGERVAAGDVVLELAADELRAQVELQRRSVDAARARREEVCRQVRQAGLDLERVERLRADAIVAADVVDLAESRHDVAQAACAAATAMVEQAHAAEVVAAANLARTILVAPFDGVVAALSTEVGEWITPTPPGLQMMPIVELHDPAGNHAVVPFDEVEVARVEVGRPVRLTMDALPGRAFDGVVARVASVVTDRLGENRTFDVEVEFVDRAFAATLLPGTSVDAEVVLEVRPDVLRIPSYALIERARVLAVVGDELVEVAVGTGLANWQWTEVVSGLTGGERVVVSLDRVEVAAGARVEVTEVVE